MGIGGWKSPCSFVRVWLLSIIWRFWALFYWSIFLSYFGVSVPSLPTVPWLQGLRPFQQHLQVWSSFTPKCILVPKAPYLVLSLAICAAWLLFLWCFRVWGFCCLFLLVVVCLAFVLRCCSLGFRIFLYFFKLTLRELAKVWQGVETTRSTIRTVYSQEKDVKDKSIYLRFLYLGLDTSKSCNFVKVKNL